MGTYNYSGSAGRSWLSIIVGLISIVVGVWCIFTPGSTLAALTIVFIAGFFAAGFFDICLAFSNTRYRGWGWRLVSGIIDILLGAWLCAIPAAGATTVLVYIVGFYILFYSLMGFGESFRLRRYGIGGWGWMAVFNVVGIITSLLFLLSPVLFGGIFLSWLVGIAFISYGLFRLMLPKF